MSVVTQKPNIRNSWAAAGTVVIPDIDRILGGWVEEIPPSEIANWIENRQDLCLRYLFQEGFAVWDAQFEFSETSLTKYNGVVYMAKVLNTNKQPDANPDVWEIAFDKYGASAAVKEIVDKIVNEAGFLTHYVLKSNPEMTGVAKAPAFQASVGFPSTTKGGNTVGLTFQGDDNSGLFRSGSEPNARLGLFKDGNLLGLVPTGTEDVNSNNETLVTTAFLKRVIDARFSSTLIQVGASLITSNPANPADYLGYGTWELDCQGRSIVGVSTSTSPAIPEWAKIVNNIFGEYNHLLTIQELPTFQTQVEMYRSGNVPTGGNWTRTGNTNGFANDSSTDSAGFMKSEPIGGGQAISLVQPSHTKYVYTRVG